MNVVFISSKEHGGYSDQSEHLECIWSPHWRIQMTTGFGQRVGSLGRLSCVSIKCHTMVLVTVVLLSVASILVYAG